MSKFYEIRPVEIVNFLSTHKLRFRENASNYTLQYCPLCPKPHNGEYDNMYTLNIIKSNGAYHCFRCGSKGNWFDFKDKVVQKYYGKSLSELVGDTTGVMSGGGPSRAEAMEQAEINAKYDIKLAHNYFLQM